MVLVVVCGCVADEPPPAIRAVAKPPFATPAIANLRQGDAPPDVCALAAELPGDDACSLLCDPPALAARLVADGSRAGACYELYCALPDASSVVVGVCLPPS